MKVAIGLKISPELEAHYREHIPEEIELIYSTDPSEETLLELAPEIDMLITHKITKAFMEKAQILKHIQVPWAGSETLDFSLLKQYPHITVSNSRSNSLAIAEHAVALLLAAAKRIPFRDSHMRKGDWSPRYDANRNSFWVTGKTLGVIGYGAIGAKVARILKSGFNMKIYAIKRHSDKKQDDGIHDFLGGTKDIPFVLQESDFVLIALPLTPETEGIIGHDELKLLKQTAIIINISRGPIIDEGALYEHLKDNKFGAALDTWYNYPALSPLDPAEPENVFQNYPFEELDNLVMSPHLAWKVPDPGIKASKDIIENVMLISKGKDPINRINVDLGY
ncbi:MAG: 2-hydroxyacid dehydrogenase [Candidatus Heimdallarchaeota archaeon]